ncbi:MAG: ion transporter [Hyphomicrobiales bacterium]|nr:ion transporter [Hyphomicrobiales bacterium]
MNEGPLPSNPCPEMTGLREKLRRLVEDPRFEKAVIALIIVNAITLGLETSDTAMAAAGTLLLALDRAILTVFVVEIILRLYVRRLAFWRDPWRVFDFIVVAIALIPASGNLSVLRAFRILRVLRLVSTVPSMRRVVQGLLHAVPGMGSIVLLLSLIFYVFSVMATKLYGETFPEWFGTIGASAYTLFQIMTLESWSMGIVRPVMEAYPMAWAFFLPFILATAFTVLNLFIGIIVDAMQSTHNEEAQEERAQVFNETALVLEEVRALRKEVAALKEEMDKRDTAGMVKQPGE